MARVHIFGNSVGYGLFGGNESWPHLMKLQAFERQQTDIRPRVSILNLSSPGTMLSHVLESGLIPATANCNRRGRQIGIFCVGLCESSILRSQGQTAPRRPLEDFATDLVRLNEVVAEHAVTPILMGVTPVGKEAFLTPEKDEFCDERVAEYDAAISEHALAAGTDYVDLRSGFEPDAMLAPDGLHPNEKGNRFMHDRVWPAVLSHLVDRSVNGSSILKV